MTEQIEAHRKRAWLFAWAFFLCAVLGYSAVIFAVREPPPFVDYPDWVYQGVLFHGALTGHPVAGYALKHYPVPNSTTTVALGLLDCVMPWQWAGKVWIVCYLWLGTFSFWALLRALRIREWRLVAAVPAIVLVNLNFWWGHIGFEVGFCLVLLLFAMLVQARSAAAIAAMLVLAFFTHMEACASAVLLLGIWCATTRSWKKMWAAVPVVGLTAWYAVARFAGGNLDGLDAAKANYAYGSPAFLIFKVNTFFKTFGYIDARTAAGLSLSERMLGKSLFLVMIVASLVLAGLCLTQLLRSVAKRQGTPQDVARRVIARFVLALLILSAVLPQVFLGVADPGSRLLLMAVAIGLLMIDWRGRVGASIACLGVLFCVVNLWQFAKVEIDPRMEGHRADLPAAVLKYGSVVPAASLSRYEALERGQMDETIFSTALFLKTPK
jgi:hypothetical protein